MVGGNALISNRFYELQPFTYSKNAINDLVKLQQQLNEGSSLSLFNIPFLSESFLTQFIYHNHGLEGIRLNYSDITDAVRNIPSSRQLDAKNSMKAHKFVFGDSFRFCLEDIVEAHTILMDGIIQNEDNVIPELGLRKSPVYLGFEFQGFDPMYVEESLDKLSGWVNARKNLFENKFSKSEVINVLHLGINFYFNFERIHPFNDGNGRLGRILLLRLLCETQHYPFYFSEQKRSQHMSVFDRTIRGGNRRTFSDFFIKEYRSCLKDIDE